jgi:glycosyltransferase involved in cell wall biosynthesis
LKILKMNEKMNILQFSPYFPPHKWGVETVAEEIADNWVKKWYWEVINITFDVWQENKNSYTQKGYKVFLLPSFDIISNFPVPKFWKKEFWNVIKEIKQYSYKNKNTRVITHTRFFLSSLIGWLFARRNNLKWIHIEHGSDYVKLSSKLKSKISYFYDKIIWKWIFKKAEKVLAISNACKKFIVDEFVEREVEVFYRGVVFPEKLPDVEKLSEKFPWKKIVGFVWRLLKWKNVESLIIAYNHILKSWKSNIQLVIVWDWEDFNRLKKLDEDNQIYFTGSKNYEDALAYQKQFDIHIHPSSPWGGLATTLLQAMNYGCYIVATPYEWAKEVIVNWRNWILIDNDSVNKIEEWIINANDYFDNKLKYSDKNRKIIDDSFSWEKNIEKLFNKVK